LETGSFGYNANDEVSSETYDANGNALTAGGKTFAYDSANRLTSMNGGQVTLVYDGDGNRVAKTVGGVTTQYLVDGLNPTGYPQVVEELVNGAVTRQYAYGLQRISENQVISNVWTPSFYGYDSAAGNVRFLSNAAGAVTDTYEYDAFGNQIYRSGTTPNNFLYRGEQFDSDLGLYYLRARYYNPATGRFLSRDPEEGVSTDPASLHKYLYVGGDPVNWIDPRGRLMVEVAEQTEEEEVKAAPTISEAGRKVAECFLGVAITIYTILEEDNPYASGAAALAMWWTCFSDGVFGGGPGGPPRIKPPGGWPPRIPPFRYPPGLPLPPGGPIVPWI
jgi:RHS repeat-associated protein